MKNTRNRLFQLILFFITFSALILVFLALKINLNTNPIKIYQKFYSQDTIKLKRYQKKEDYFQIPCSIFNGKYSTCLKSTDNSSVYVSFGTIRKKFDISGIFDENNRFKIKFSDAIVYNIIEKYDSIGEYLWFKDLNVESRDRVKYISLKENVPVSSQWNKSGHFYPIQIAQFGLSHYSKWFQFKKVNSSLFKPKNFTIDQNNKFIISNNLNFMIKKLENGFEFKSPERSIYKTNYSYDFRYLIADLYTNSSFNLTIDLMLRDSSIESGIHIINLIYSFNSNDKIPREFFTTESNSDKSYNIVYQINYLINNQPLKFVRNLCIDCCKALKIKCDKCLKSLNDTMMTVNGSTSFHFYKSQYFKVYQIAINGEGKITNGILSDTSPNFELSKKAADYLISSQNKITGGWKINISRKFVSNSKKIILNSGWYSSMAQGQSISLLCRLYNQTKDNKYYESAKKALILFEIDSHSNGIRANFMNSSLVWFEEYPTKPNSLFVLNGFLYSIFGLSDFLNGCKNIQDKYYYLKAKELFLMAIKSLTTLINLFDSGTRTFYDLGHISDSRINPNIARWDYHALHISQLNYLENILENLDENFDHKLMQDYAKQLKTVAFRWNNYMKGIWYSNSQIKE